MTIDKIYHPHAIEARWYRHWEAQGYFAPSAAATPYCIMIPPPNVTGSLHMGHAFQDTLMDTLIRYHRMRGRATLWQPGTDHAGIATQVLVERLLDGEGQSRPALGRDAFMQRVWQWKAESGGMITRQLRRMGASVDWPHERFTMEPDLCRAVNEVFVTLYHEGLIYRGQRLVNWDPVLQTALSDLEVLATQEAGHLWHLRYPICDSDAQLTVATTRPETMLGDSAVAVHPDDARYQKWHGQWVELPLTGRKIPIIADTYVDPEFGSGCVKITPAHDFNDYQVWLRHRDQPVFRDQSHGGLINVFTPTAAIRDNVNNEQLSEGALIPKEYIGLARAAARDAVVKAFDQAGLLARVDAHTMMVPRGDRSGAVIEPYLTDQWYVDLTREQQADGRAGGKVQMVAPALAAVQSGAIRFVPENWTRTYYQWLENIEDWCISRQIWWGHRIPAWYDDEDNIYVGMDETEVRTRYQLASDLPLRQDDDVLDTWFSSALWPFSTLGWPESTARLQTFYPTSVLVTGFDIIFFWVARMIMMGLKFMQKAPFGEVYIHGLIRDAEGQKMSKSKGNVLDPIDLIDGISLAELTEKRTNGLMQPHLTEKIAARTRTDYPNGIPAFGTDALRFTFTALAARGRDIYFDLGRIEGYRNFCNKIWNAARFVLQHCADQDCGQNSREVTLSLADRWMISCVQRSARAIAESIAKYRFDWVAQELYELSWNKYCDWYVELCKPQLQNADCPVAVQIATRRTLVQTLETILRLLHPIMPFITEEIWQKIAPLAGIVEVGKPADKVDDKVDDKTPAATIMMQPYPQYDPKQVDTAAEAELAWVMQFIIGVRNIRGEMNISPARAVAVLLADYTDEDIARMHHHHTMLKHLGKLESLAPLPPATEPPPAATAMVGSLKLLIPLAGLIDQAAETARLNRQLAQLTAELAKLEAKLANPGFRNNAPATVVRQTEQKQQDYQRRQTTLATQLEKLAQL